MYLDYETYYELSSDPVSEEVFSTSEPWAEAVLDVWTLNRLQAIDWSAWKTKVELVMCQLVDKKDVILAGEEGSPLDSFSNGVDTFHFSSPEVNHYYRAVKQFAWDVLPVELISRVVSYNGAS